MLLEQSINCLNKIKRCFFKWILLNPFYTNRGICWLFILPSELFKVLFFSCFKFNSISLGEIFFKVLAIIHVFIAYIYFKEHYTKLSPHQQQQQWSCILYAKNNRISKKDLLPFTRTFWWKSYNEYYIIGPMYFQHFNFNFFYLILNNTSVGIGWC